jgi:tyrosyl-tRNA synthetase
MNLTNEIEDVLSRGVENIIPSKETLKTLLESGKKLNIYLGIDPTATRIHIGHAVQLRKLQKFADLGHNVTFLIGDFTALIGDTSDKNSERPSLTTGEINQNFQSYKRQASKFLDFEKVTVRFNSEWLSKLTFPEIVKLCQQFSVGDFVSRELIRNRLQSGKRVALHETLYPVMQGYDSWFLDTDIQIGGTDQTFNMQAGRTLLRNLNNKESFVLANGFLMGTDGNKMSKSQGNAIWIEDAPEEMFGKILSLLDSEIINYFTLGTNLTIDAVEEKKKRLSDGENPLILKKELAWQIISEIYSEEDAQKAQEKFEQTFQEKKPIFEETIENKDTLAATIAELGSVQSMTTAKRLIKDNAVDVNGETVTDPATKVSSGYKIQVGKKIFVTVK